MEKLPQYGQFAKVQNVRKTSITASIRGFNDFNRCSFVVISVISTFFRPSRSCKVPTKL